MCAGVTLQWAAMRLQRGRPWRRGRCAADEHHERLAGELVEDVEQFQRLPAAVWSNWKPSA
jgi:hypothetical protein